MGVAYRNNGVIRVEFFVDQFVRLCDSNDLVNTFAHFNIASGKSALITYNTNDRDLGTFRKMGLKSF